MPWRRALIAGFVAATLVGCSHGMYILFSNKSGTAVTVSFVNPGYGVTQPVRVGRGRSKLFPHGSPILRLSTGRCELDYLVPELPEGEWGDWRVRMRLEKDFSFTLVQPRPGINKDRARLDIWKVYGVTVRPTSRRCR